MNMNASPRDGFRSFLERAEDDGWVAGYRWLVGESWPSLREKLGGPPKPGVSRTHKKGTDGRWWALEIEAHEGTAVGIDLEILFERPILERPGWILRRLGIGKPAAPKNLIEEWSSRECVFHALAPENDRVLLSQLRRTAPGTFGVLTQQGDRLVQVRTNWAGKWCLSIGWRSL